jgi:hypothetical protein
MADDVDDGPMGATYRDARRAVAGSTTRLA